MNAKSKVVDSHDPCHDLRTALLTASPAKFERLAGCLLGRLLGIPFKIARSGDQRGGDGGVSGAGGRHLIFEARRYGDNSRLDERGIVGEIEQAVERNPALEAWILVTTREVPEQIQDAMVRAGFRHGIDTVIIDWFPQSLPKLAVLCACYPGCFEAEIGKGHGHLLESITAKQDYDAALKAIRSELDSWVIGYEAVRQASHAWVQEIWQSPRKASAMFGQDVAGGDEAAHHVRRPALIDRLDAWLEVATTGHPGALVGPDGVGKTWIAVDWLQSRLDRLPIIVMVPSSTIGNAIASRSDLIMFIARYLHEIMPVRNEPFWEQRVRRLLERPADEGSTFLLFFDGLNQRVSFDWPEVFRKLQDEPFYQRTLTLMSARTSFFEDRLHGCRALVDEPQRIDVGGYDLSPGGTFDQKLALAGLSRDNFPSHLVNLAAVPRLFDLVVQLRDDLGDASEVTVHRLLWEYGASTIVTSTDGAFSRNDWRLFILELAEGHQGGNRNYTVRRVTDLSDDATLTRDQIYQRISSVVDSIFAKLTGHGKLDFHPDFVHHALGLALVNQMEQTESDEDSRNRLEQFLDPIEGYDDHAEILRAAVTITLQKDIYPQPTWLSTLCTFWIHTQNLPDSHLIEMAILAPKLIEPLLDVIEASDGHALSTSRYIAINALDQVDKSDQLIASNIAQRGVRWLSFISLEKREPDADREENSLYAMRCKWLRERIGVTEVGEVIIAGRAFEIVNHKGDDLIIAVAQLLQGRPLQGAIEFFEVGAIHTAVVEGGKVQETQTWLNILNIIDPEDTASGLRHASDRIRSRAPEPGVHSDLNKRIASLLLWQTGYVNDARMAWANDPKIDLWHRYEKDYLPDPSRSIFPLERRHTAQVLRDTDLPVIRRIERARDALLDPSFDIPSEFIDELLSTANSFEFTRTATGRMRTGEDHDWDLLSQALARCAPDKLADLERARLRQYAERPEEHRFGSALTARHAMLLVGKDESAALQTLRERGNNGSNDDENTILTYMLITEIQCEPPTAQFRRIMETGIDRIDLLLAQACDPPSERELDYLLDEYGDDEEQLSKLASLLTVHDLKLSEQAFLALSKLLKPGEADAGLAGVWILLALNDSDRLGAMLDKTGWTWSSDKSYTENLMGSIAIAASNRGRTFIEYASRIAPAKLLEILSQKECSRADVELAVNLLDGALFGYSGDTPEPGVEISQEQNSAQFEWYEFTAGDLVEDGDNQIDVLRFFGRVNSPELREKKRYKVIQTYRDEVRKARRMGDQLYLANFTAEDFEPVLKHCPGAVDNWLDGLETSSPDFIKRVRQAENFFIALCESLLKEDTPRGMSLWRVLREHLIIKHISYTNIDRLLHALFAAPPCAEVDAALEEIYGIDEARTDEDLINLVIEARSTSRVDWLRRMVDLDKLSPCPAHRRRATFLEPLLKMPDIAGDMNWPSGQAAGVFDSIHETAWILGQREAFAHHWLQAFVKAKTPDLAHAYWCVFEACSDRRAWVWMRNVCESQTTTNERLNVSKQKFIRQEKYSLRQAMAKNEKSWSDKFAGRKYTRILLPWSFSS